ncbi:MAG: matrixin family metalloprotease, partial [Candidatus Latescibacterota bacterium]
MTRCRWVVALLLTASPASAFLVQSTQSGNGPVVQVSWAGDEIPYRIDAVGSDDLGTARTAQILRESFAVWEDVEGSRLRFRDEGSSTGIEASRRDRQNLLIFDETGDVLDAPAGSGIIAVTRMDSDVRTGNILDADIVFNGRDFRFASEPTAGRILLRDVAVHEIGHFIGLDHTPLSGTPERRPTMNPFYFGDGGEAATLAADDITGIRALYPTTAFAASSGTITGHVADIEGTSVFGAHVTALNLDSGDTYSTLSG